MRILLIAHFCDEVGLGGNNRFNYLASFLVQQGHIVELVTSGFSHTTKQPKQVQPSEVTEFKLTYIEEPGYTRNVSLRRFWAHRVMARNLSQLLNVREQASATPDIIYCAVPSLAVAEVASQYAYRVRKPLVVDVQDLWPEAFYMVGPLRKIAFIFRSLEAQASTIYASADAVVAVSQRYQQRALKAGRASRPSQVLYLGTDLQRFDAHATDSLTGAELPNRVVEFVYLGTLGHSYDLKTAIRAFKVAQQKTKQLLQLTVIGDGPLQDEFKAYARQLGVTVEFTGRLAYEQTVQRLVRCDVALNVIRKGAAQSIINKHADYAAAGLPVLSTQECSEYRALLAKFNAGIHCNVSEFLSEQNNELVNGMVELAENSQLRLRLGKGSRAMAETLFDRQATYPQLLELLEATLQQESAA